MRAREPDHQGYVDNDGVKIGYEAFGDGTPTILLLPTWTIVNARFWKAQVHYLARHFRVVTFDGPGNGRSDRVLDPQAYSTDAYANAALEVLDATGTGRAVLVSLSAGAQWQLQLMATRPDRCLGGVFIAPSLAILPGHPARNAILDAFDEPLPTVEGWAKYNRHYWQRDWRDFSEFFFSQCFTEPHSTKQIEDCVGWSLESSVDVMLADAAAGGTSKEQILAWCDAIESAVLVIHGDDDRISPLSRGKALAEATGGTLVAMEGAGHIPLARDPVAVNLAIAEFVRGLAGDTSAPRRWSRGRTRPKRALYISSPIGLGHAQ
ncbi:MAG: alpha/beta fold hydrolase, partial [Nitriliruptorales bacterium]|nr:alpha/beta fold hydrolase [Nitriliruptorales bacterium]